ncbi:MAG: fused MFS/spermidine synthase, partial [Myxococcota bacterium]|nr:fused MFS/spermidine synthase [Myxococcota bacterium]
MLPVRALCAIFFVSGAAALLFETLWFRQAGLAFGNGVWASSLVLSSFMAGLALGNGLTIRLGVRLRRPLRTFALLEGVVAATGLGLVWGLPVLSAELAALLGPLLDRPWLLNPLRLGIAFLCLLVPATAMGATLPVLVSALQRHDPSFGSVLGRLYGFNTLGAMVGALAGELALIEWLGIRGSAGAAAALDALAALAALALAPRIDDAPGRGRAPGEPWLDSRRRLLALAAAAALSGAALLALEVVWFRFLLLFVNPTALSFAVMLAVVLAGIALGGAAAGAWARRRPAADGHAAGLAFLAGAAAVGLYALFPRVFAPYGTAFVTEARDVTWLAACLTGPVCLLSGALFTLTGTALHREIGPEVRAAGLLTLSNTIGAGLGAFAGGFVLLPWLGVERSLFALAALYGVVGALLVAVRAPAAQRARPLRRLAAAPVLAAALALFPFGSMLDEHLEVVRRRLGPNTRIERVSEGRTETVIYLRSELRGETISNLLLTGAFGMASDTVLTRRYMKLFVYWAMAMHPEARSALLISYGVGNTAKALTDTASLDRIDVVDISRDVLAASDVVFPEPGEDPLGDPRVEVHVEDGRYFLQSSARRYDLITSEPPPPKHASVNNLYSREYFELIRKRLAPGGVNTYWLPVSTLTLRESLAITRAYCDAFPDCTLWVGTGATWMLAGSREAAWPPSEEGFSRQWRDERVRPELVALGLERPEQLGALFLGDARWLAERTRDVEPLVDDFPRRLGTGGPDARDWATYWEWMEPEAARERFAASAFAVSAWPSARRTGTLAAFEAQGLINDVSELRWRTIPPLERLRRLERALTATDLAIARHRALQNGEDFHTQLLA